MGGGFFLLGGDEDGVSPSDALRYSRSFVPGKRIDISVKFVQTTNERTNVEYIRMRSVNRIDTVWGQHEKVLKG
jgi:hypothetical protein